MNQRFNRHLDDLRNNARFGEDENVHYKKFKMIGPVRNLCLTWPDGKMEFFNYAYLVSGKYYPDESIIELVFTSETITLKGIRLNLLIRDFLMHLPQEIICTEARYNETFSDTEFIVNEIIVVKSS